MTHQLLNHLHFILIFTPEAAHSVHLGNVREVRAQILNRERQIQIRRRIALGNQRLIVMMPFDELVLDPVPDDLQQALLRTVVLVDALIQRLQ